jgi:hypothetical protein
MLKSDLSDVNEIASYWASSYLLQFQVLLIVAPLAKCQAECQVMKD